MVFSVFFLHLSLHIPWNAVREVVQHELAHLNHKLLLGAVVIPHQLHAEVVVAKERVNLLEHVCLAHKEVYLHVRALDSRLKLTGGDEHVELIPPTAIVVNKGPGHVILRDYCVKVIKDRHRELLL